jgi:hypothetical protein
MEASSFWHQYGLVSTFWHQYGLVSTFWMSILLVGWFMVFNDTVDNISTISWRSVLLVEETGVPEENNRSIASH